MQRAYKDKVYSLVKAVPRGFVTTYGALARSIGGITPRMVGRALHENKSPETIPCHRVVNSQGRVALNFAFGGEKAQKELLMKEGVSFKNEYRVDLERAMWEISAKEQV